MKTRKMAIAIAAAAGLSAVFVAGLDAQGPGGGKGKGMGMGMGKGKAAANVSQLMKGVFYINSNVIFAAQAEDPNKMKGEKDTSVSPNALTSAYGKWEAVENSALAIADATPLLMIPRTCSSGVAAPIGNPQWGKFVSDLREAGLQAYAAAKTKDQDKIVEVAEVITTACANCHDKWRETAKMTDRCK